MFFTFLNLNVMCQPKAGKYLLKFKPNTDYVINSIKDKVQ